MLGYTARVVGATELRQDDDEIARRRLAHPRRAAGHQGGKGAVRVEHLPPPVSIARRIIDDWLAGLLP